MWWLYYNLGQIITLISAASYLPHYTVAFKPFFEFIVLGVIPGTSLEIGFITSLILGWLLFTVVVLSKLLSSSHSKLTLHHQ